MGKNVELLIEGNSNAERYYMENIVPKLKDKHSCLLGDIFGLYNEDGKPINGYIISKRDRRRLKKDIDILKNIHS